MKIHKGNKIELEIKASDLIISKLNFSIQEKGRGVLAVPGGSSPLGIFKILSSSDLDWEKVYIFLVDERWVSLDDKDSNYKNLEDNLLIHIDIPEDNVYKFYTSKGVEGYQEQFTELDGKVDVCLLGIGPDGHVASLFPDHPSIKYNGEGYFEVSNSPKMPPRRISLSKKSILESDTIIGLIFGEEKRQAFDNFMDDSLSINDCPAKIIKEGGDAYLFAGVE